ncbi:MAG: carboxypeptidase regulatory-like domain-containing protein [Deltaproteobacteria bacterium]|nr:carboxypeptidase regulatory-like domain-containing protein [Deltaproteobacteria bacterium]
MLSAASGMDSAQPEPSLGIHATTASIGGDVRDPQQRPVPHAEVCAWTFSRDLASAATARPRCTTSGVDGHYRIDGLHAVPYRVGASAPRRHPAMARDEDGSPSAVELMLGEHREHIDLVLASGGVPLRGVVRDVGGGPIEGAWIAAAPYTASTVVVGAQGIGTQTNADGQFTLWARPGSATLTAAAVGYTSSWVLAAAPDDGIELSLIPESVLAGVVLDPRQRPVPNARVTLRVTAPGAAPFTRTRTAFSDSEGGFRFEQLPPGRYKPKAIADGLYGLAPQSVRLGVGDTSELVRLQLAAAAQVTGLVAVDDDATHGCPRANVGLRGPVKMAANADDEGRVHWPAVPHGEYEVRVQCPGHFGPRNLAPVTIAADRDDLRWSVQPGRALRGSVRSSTGDPIAHAIVTASTDRLGVAAPSPYLEGHTNTNGLFTLAGLAPDLYQVNVYAEGYAIMEPFELEVTEDTDPETLDVELRQGAVVEGVVVDDEANPVPGVLVRLGEDRGIIAHHAKAEDDPGRGVIFMHRFGRSISTDAHGRFRMAGVHTGKWMVFAHTLQLTILDEPEGTEPLVLTVEDGQRVEVELRIAGRGETMRGRVLDSEGAAVADAFVVVEPGTGSTHRRVAPPQLTDADGWFSVQGVPAGQHRVRATVQGGGEATAEGVSPEETVILRLTDTAQLEGTIEGSAPPAFEVRVEDPHSGFRRHEKFAGGRTFVLADLPPGAYDVTVSSDQGHTRVDGVPLASGQTRAVSIALQTRAPLSGTVVDLQTAEPLAGFVVTAGALGGPMRAQGEHNVTDAQGWFELPNVPLGEVGLHIYAQDGRTDHPPAWITLRRTDPDPLPAPITLAASTVSDAEIGTLGFELATAPPGAPRADHRFTVGSVDPRGPAQAAGIEVGDEIVAVDGHDVTGDTRHLYGPLTRVEAGRSLTLRLRDGEEHELVAASQPG